MVQAVCGSASALQCIAHAKEKTMNDRDNMNTYLRSIATQAVQAQHTDNTELLWDLLTDIEKDVSLALNILEDIETTRERGDDDGIEYADPRDYKDGLE